MRCRGSFPAPEIGGWSGRACWKTLARTGRAAMHPDFLTPQMEAGLTLLLGRPLENPGMVFAELMMASLEADPDNRDGYLFLLDLLRGQATDKRKLQWVLQDMADRFPDDATPWLELATLHYSRNAYRRAESALEAPRERTPHDDRLLDLQAVGFLKSAEQSRRQGRFALADRDLKAGRGTRAQGDRAGPAHEAAAARDGLGRRGRGRTVAACLESLLPGAQLWMLALLSRDLRDGSHVRNVTPETVAAVQDLLADRVTPVGECVSDEVVRLLELLPVELDLLYDERRLAPIFAAWWPALLERVDAERLPAVLDILMECGGVDRGWTQARREIERRLRGVRKARRDPLLLFYPAAIRYEDGSDRDARRFEEVLSRADAATRERLRAAGARLARHMYEPLRHALVTFDFEALDLRPAAPGGEPPSLDELLASIGELPEAGGLPRGRAGSSRGVAAPDPDDPSLVERFRRALAEDAADAREQAAQQGMLLDRDIYDDLDRLEDLIDDNRLRGEPPSVLREFAGNLRAEPQARQELDPAAVHAAVAAGGGSSAAAVSARVVDGRLPRGAAGAAWRGRFGPESDEHRAADGVVGRGVPGVPAPGPVRERLRLRVGRRDPLQHPSGRRPALHAGGARGASGRDEGTVGA